jgi:hypothetical protein
MDRREEGRSEETKEQKRREALGWREEERGKEREINERKAEERNEVKRRGEEKREENLQKVLNFVLYFIDWHD